MASSRGSWVDAFAGEATPGGVRYDEILTGAADQPRLRAVAGIATGVLLFFVLAPAVSQLLGLLGWVLLRPVGSLVDWLGELGRFENPWGMLSGHLALAVLIPISGAMVLFVHRRQPKWLGSVRPWFRWRYLLASMVVAVVLFNVVLLIQHLGQPLPVLRPQADYWVFLVVMLLTSPLQAAAEEFFFRGYLLQAFQALAPRVPWLGVACSAVLFALFHGTQNPPLFLDRLAFGLLAGVLVVGTGGLEAAIGAHVINNLMAFGYAGLYSTIAEVKATQTIGWLDLAWDLAGFGLYAVLAVLLARRWKLDVRTSGAAPAHR